MAIGHGNYVQEESQFTKVLLCSFKTKVLSVQVVMGSSCSIVHIKNSVESSSANLSPEVSSVLLEASEAIICSVVARHLSVSSVTTESSTDSYKSVADSFASVYSGAWKMASMTNFEKSLISDLWRSIIRDHPYWTEGVFHRLFSNHPESKRLHVFVMNMKGSIQNGDATKIGNLTSTGKESSVL